MARANASHKPGEKAPASGEYYCYICSLREIESSCRLEQGEMFLACPRCLERKVAEWDMTWKSVADRPGRNARAATPWPGSLLEEA